VPLHTHEVYTPLSGVGVAETAAAVQISKLSATGQPVHGHSKALLPATDITCLPLMHWRSEKVTVFSWSPG